MDKIFFCTDLSPHSKSALNFSLEIAKKTHSKIIIVHGINLPAPIPVGDPAFQPIPISIDQTRDEIKEELSIICDEIQSHRYGDSKAIECEYKAEIINPEIEILQEAQKINPDLIIMGSKHVHGFMKLFETIVTKIIKKSTAPVLVVPEGSSYKKFKNIVYTTDLKEESEDTNRIIEFAKIFDSYITFLHINDPNHPFADRKKYSAFEERMLKATDYKKIEFESVTSTDTISILEDYIRKKQVDLLIMLRHNTTFFERIFHKSATKEIIFYSKIPVMVVHYNGNTNKFF